jgi:hypothetical protein
MSFFAADAATQTDDAVTARGAKSGSEILNKKQPISVGV